MATQTLIPHLTVRDGASALEFYKRAFGAEEKYRVASPDGRIMHATMEIGGSTFQLNDEYPEWQARAPISVGGTSVELSLNFDTIEAVDRAWKRAVDAGAKVTMPLANQFWGGRYGHVEDPSGHRWSFHARAETVSDDELKKRAAEALKR
jgi:PhnB protein